MRRRGFGILIAIVVLLMACLLVAGLSQLFLSGQVYGQSAGGAGGMAAEYLAESAIDDVLAQLSTDLNDPDTAVFREVRMALLTRKPPVVDLTGRYRLRHLTSAISASAEKGFHRLFDVSTPKVVLRVAPETDTGEPQLLEMSATARLEMGRRSVARTVFVTRQVGITRVAPRRPFDSVPFAIVRTRVIADARELATEIATSVKSFNRTGELLEGWKAAVEGKPLGTPMTASLPPLAVGPERATDPIAVQLLADEQYFYRAVWDEVEEIDLAAELPPDDSVIFARPKETVQLADFQYYRRLEELRPLVEELREARERFGPVMEPIERAARRGTLSSAEHSAWAGKMDALGKDLVKVLVPLQEKLLAIAAHMKAHTAPGVTTGAVDRPRHWESAVPVWPLAHHISGGKAFQELVTTWPAVSGHLAVYSGPPPRGERPPGDALFTFKHDRWRGQAIVSLEEGALAVGALALDGPRDVLVVSAPTIQVVEPAVQAALVARQVFRTDTDVTINGSVIIEEYTKPASPEDEAPWRGTVRYDSRLRSGKIRQGNDLSQVVLGRYTVGISPRVSRKEVRWR